MELRLDYPAEKWRNVYKVRRGMTCNNRHTLLQAACVPEESKMHMPSEGSCSHALSLCSSPG